VVLSNSIFIILPTTTSPLLSAHAALPRRNPAESASLFSFRWPCENYLKEEGDVGRPQMMGSKAESIELWCMGCRVP
jgi:hypothetical protein